MRKNIRTFGATIIAVLLIMTTSCSPERFLIESNEFEYQEVSAPNPMKGFASVYPLCTEDSSLEYIGLRFSEIYQYDEKSTCFTINSEHLDRILTEVANRGNSLILRTYIIYPGYNNGEDTGIYLPENIYNELKADGEIYSNKYGGHTLEYPNFNNSKLLEYIEDFITKLGEKYDGHPAIAAIQLGLYGSWGEWNMAGCQKQKCAMTNQNMQRLLSAYTKSFKTTKLMARNPSLGKASEYAVGFHDDNFLFNTSDFHTKNSKWKALLESLNKNYGTLQQFYDFINGCNGNYEPIWDKWQTEMFGGELSGMLYDEPFGSILDGTEREALDYCINQFHMTWLSGVGQGGIPEKGTDEYKEYLEIARSFGYEIGITDVSAINSSGKITVSLKNYGIAPFYYNWPIEYVILNSSEETVYTYRDEDFALSELLPECTAQTKFNLPKDLKSGKYTVTLQVVNPSENFSTNSRPMKLANNHAVKDGIYEIASFTIR